MLRKISVAINVLRKNGFLGELQCLADNPPTLKMEDSANIKMVLQGTFKKNVLDRWKHYVEFDPLTDALQPVLTINGISYELGIFLPTTVTPSYKDTAVEETIEIEAYDRSWLVATTTGTERVFFARGTAYMEAIEQLLVASGISLIKSTPCSDVLHEDREDWDLGTDYLTIVNDLLKEINYKQLWFDFTGTAILEPIETPMVKNVKHTLDVRNVTSLVHPGLSRKLDIYGTPNVFICTCNNPEKSAVLTAIARNENDHSPLSIQRRGREIVYYENVNNVASQEALQTYADRLLFISMMSGETMSVTTSLFPDWGIGDIVSLHYLDVHALCVSHSWNMTLAAGGTMTHDLEKIVYNLDAGIYTDDTEDDDEEYKPYNPWGDDDDDNEDDKDDEDDDNDDTLPDEIIVNKLPNKFQYNLGETIDFTGIEVNAYADSKIWTNDEYPNGIIPFEELAFSTTVIPEVYPTSSIIFVYWNRPVDKKRLSSAFAIFIRNTGNNLPRRLEISWQRQPEDYYMVDEVIDFISDSKPTIRVDAVYDDGHSRLVSNNEITIKRTGRTLVETVVPVEVPELNIAHEVYGTYRYRSKDGEQSFNTTFKIIPDDENAICFTFTEASVYSEDSLVAGDHTIWYEVLSANSGSYTINGYVRELTPLLKTQGKLRKYGGKQAYYGGGGQAYEEGYAQLSVSPAPSESITHLAYGGYQDSMIWTLVHGSYNVYTDTYTVSWPRKEDGQIITGTFEITTRG